MKIQRYALISLLTLCCFGCGVAPKQHILHASTERLPDHSSIAVMPLTVPKLRFLGRIERQEVNEAGHILYPGDAGIAGLIIGIATHAAVQKSSDNSRESSLQTQANQVLQRFSKALSELDSKRAIDTLVKSNARFRVSHNPNSVRLQIDPIFYIDQTVKTITLKNIVIVTKNDQATIYKNLVEVVQALPNGLDQLNHLEKTDFLRATTDSMIQESVNLAVQDAQMAFSSNQTFRTFRYVDQDKYSYERATLIYEDCKTTVVRSLRKWIKSRPTSFYPDSKIECSSISQN